MKKLKKTIASLIAATLLLAWAMPLMAADMGKVNINTATKERIATLNGVGETYADRIIEYRQTNGPFQSPSDIVKVKGIGEKTYELNKDRIIVKDE
jgi:competence protein ComEA